MGLKILHTSDWHLGKKLYKVSRLEEQKLFLDWLLKFIKEEKIDLVCLSGDVFDSPRPSDEALKTYFNFLQDFAEQTNAKLYIISGNHDSGSFLEAPDSLLKNQERVFISGVFKADAPIEQFQHYIKNSHGDEVVISMLPYFRSFDLIELARIHQASPSKEDKHHQEEEKLILEGLDLFFEKLHKQIENYSDQGPMHILMAHHLFGNFQEAGSELGLYLSGLDSIPNSLLENRFDYVALGHIHKAQVIKSQNPLIRYCGSPIPFRFSENTNKSIFVVETGKKHDHYNVYQHDVPVFRELLSIKTDDQNYLSDLEAFVSKQALNENKLPALAEVHCKIQAPVSGLRDILREAAHQKGVQLLNVQTHFPEQEESEDSRPDANQHYSTEELFELFYAQKFPETPEVPKDLKNQFQVLLEQMRRQEHEKYQEQNNEN